MANEVRDFIKDFGKVPKDFRSELRPALRVIGNEVRAEAQRRSAWSKRIPAATRVSVGFTKRNPGVSVVVNRVKAPHARPLENRGLNGMFRHPVFGHKDRKWEEQPARPFLAPAAEAKADNAAAKVADVWDIAARRAGFR